MSVVIGCWRRRVGQQWCVRGATGLRSAHTMTAAVNSRTRLGARAAPLSLTVTLAPAHTDARLGLDVPTPLKVHVSPGKPQIDPDLARALRARYSALRGDIAAARVSVPTGIDGDDNDDEGGTGAEARRQKDRAWDWSPLADYEERASETMAIAAQLRKTTGSNVATRRAPAFTVGKARRTLQTTEGKPATGPDVGPAKYDVSKLHKATSNSRSAPSFSIGVKLKSDEERAVACGYPLLPAPGQGVPVPSFVRESVVENKGPRLMGKLPTRAEIDVKLGIGNGPGPGGSLEVPSFAAENKRQSRGVKLGVRLKSDAERTLALGYKITPAPGGWLRCRCVTALARADCCCFS